MSASESPSSWQRRPTTSKLPDYAHPPLVQVQLSVRFASDFSITPSVEERFQSELGPEWMSQDLPGPGLKTLMWATRLGDQRVLLTRLGLTYEWDGQAGDLYPHYPLVREGFVSVWNLWCQTVGSTPTIETWMVQYLNRIPQGTVWTTLADCSFLRWMPSLAAIEGLPDPDQLHAHANFSLDQFDARLAVSTETWPDQDPVRGEQPHDLWLRLICHGGVPDPDDTFLAGFDYGREVIVKTFRQLMQPAANEFWGLKS